MRLDDLKSLEMCDKTLSYTILNVSKLAFMGIIDGKVDFTEETVNALIPDSISYGFLSRYPLLITDGFGNIHRIYSFPHMAFQEFLAAF